MKYIQDALVEMLEKKALDKITVNDVCKIANISRQTVYYHFDSLQEVLFTWLGDSIAERLQAKNSYHNWEEGYREILTFMKEYKKIISNIYSSSYRIDFLKYINMRGRVLVTRAVDEISDECGIPMTNKDKTFLVDYYMFVFMGILEKFISEGMGDDIEYIVSRCEALMGESIKENEVKMLNCYKIG